MCRLRHPLRDRMHRQIAHGQTTRGQILHRQIAYRQTLHRQIAYRQTLHRQITYRQTLHRQIVYRQALHRQIAYRQTLHRQTAHRQILHRSTAHKCCGHRQMTHKHGTSGPEEFPSQPLFPLQLFCLLLHPRQFLPVLQRRQGFQGRPILRLFPPCSKRGPYSGKDLQG